MSRNHLSIYLNDHHAGSVLALELLSRVESNQAGTPLGALLAELRTEIEADQRELEGLMKRLGITVSPPRSVMAWFAEKGTQIKLWLDDSAGGDLRLLESLELLAIGIEGKHALWLALGSAASREPELRGVDYPRLERRAVQQRERIEGPRLQAAARAFSPQ